MSFTKSKRTRQTGGFARLLPVVGQDAPLISAWCWANPLTLEQLLSTFSPTGWPKGISREGTSPHLHASKIHSHLGFCPHAAGLTPQRTGHFATPSPTPGVRKVIPSQEGNALLNPAVLNCSALNQHLSVLRTGSSLPIPVSQPDASIICCYIFLEVSFPAWLK